MTGFETLPATCVQVCSQCGYCHTSGQCPARFNNIAGGNWWYGQGGTNVTLKFPPDPPRLHPDDIEAVAKRVVELLKEQP